MEIFPLTPKKSSMIFYYKKHASPLNDSKFFQNLIPFSKFNIFPPFSQKAKFPENVNFSNQNSPKLSKNIQNYLEKCREKKINSRNNLKLTKKESLDLNRRTPGIERVKKKIKSTEKINTKGISFDYKIRNSSNFTRINPDSINYILRSPARENKVAIKVQNNDESGSETSNSSDFLFPNFQPKFK